MQPDLELVLECNPHGETAMLSVARDPGCEAPMTCSLDELPTGQSAIVQESLWQVENSAVLKSYGFFPGSVVTRVGSAPQGDPLIFRLDRRLVAVRRETAANIVVACEDR